MLNEYILISEIGFHFLFMRENWWTDSCDCFFSLSAGPIVAFRDTSNTRRENADLKARVCFGFIKEILK